MDLTFLDPIPRDMLILGAFAVGMLVMAGVLLVVFAVPALFRRVFRRTSEEPAPVEDDPVPAIDAVRDALTAAEWNRLYPLIEVESVREGTRRANLEDVASLRAVTALSSRILDNDITTSTLDREVRLRSSAAALGVFWRHRDACAALLTDSFAATLRSCDVLSADDRTPVPVAVTERDGALVVRYDTAPIPANDFDWGYAAPYLRAACRGAEIDIDARPGDGYVEITATSAAVPETPARRRRT